MWSPATVVDVQAETSRARTLTLDIAGWTPHHAGQHLDVRLTAADGYRATRSYSVASAAGERPQITVDRLPDGEVSPYLADVALPGDQLEARGPVGGYFVWEPHRPGAAPVLLVAGGSGIVPLRAMLRTRVLTGDATAMRLLYSARALDDVIYRNELAAAPSGVDVSLTLTRVAPADWQGFTRRIDRSMLAEVSWPSGDRPDVFVCGPTAFVETVAAVLIDLGHHPSAIRTERFGG